MFVGDKTELNHKFELISPCTKSDLFGHDHTAENESPEVDRSQVGARPTKSPFGPPRGNAGVLRNTKATPPPVESSAWHQIYNI